MWYGEGSGGAAQVNAVQNTTTRDKTITLNLANGTRAKTTEVAIWMRYSLLVTELLLLTTASVAGA
jgi:hypothetical protein